MNILTSGDISYISGPLSDQGRFSATVSGSSRHIPVMVPACSGVFSCPANAGASIFSAVLFPCWIVFRPGPRHCAHYCPLLSLLIPVAAVVCVPWLNRGNRLFLEGVLNDYPGISFDLFAIATTFVVLAFFALHIHKMVTRE